MNSIRYILLFVISLILQIIKFFVIKSDSGVTILDMLIMSLLFCVFMFIIDKIIGKKKKI
ncbi:hypothetical protein ABD86_13025 [Paenibacillus alvei]|nr:hypothetical protein [Paenibacillus alvei]MBG9744818.1 hypothetical protein [Paenibacillus alvei]